MSLVKLQLGSIIGLLYQIYANDKDGIMGRTLRHIVQSTGIQGKMDDKTFATFCASLFMVVSGVLMLPEFFGGAWNPFVAVVVIPVRYAKSMVVPSVNKQDTKSFIQTGDTDPESDDEIKTPVTVNRAKRNQKKKEKKKIN
jgi:hypothetical protein